MAFFSQREVKRSHNIMKTFNFIAAVIASAMFTINAHAEIKSVNETKDTSAVEISNSSKRAMVQTSEDGKVYKYEYILDNNGRVVNKIASRWNDDNSEWTPVSAYSVVYTNTETVLSYAKYNSMTKTYSSDVKQTRFNASEYPIVIRVPECCK